MTREEAIEKLSNLSQKTIDIEESHIIADQILCELLDTLGYQDVTVVFNDLEKWYA